ncbi:MAG: hypothetical protein V1820_01640 [archaeon]
MSGIILKISAEINPTESEEKLRTALFGLFEDVRFERVRNNLSGTSESSQDLEKLRAKIFEKRIIDTVRSRLFRNSAGTQTTILLHKQALAAGRIAVVDLPDESPLGAVELSVSAPSSEELENFINWFSPETREGVVVSIEGKEKDRY